MKGEKQPDAHACSTLWVGHQSRRFLCLFWRETRQRILGHDISPYLEVGRGREWELATGRQGDWTAERQLTGDPDESSWRWTAERSWRRTRMKAVGDERAERRDREESWLEKELRGSWRRDSREGWRGTTDRGSQHRTPETVGDKIGSSEEDRLKMSAFEVLGEFSLVTHASDSPHMHIVLQYLFSALPPQPLVDHRPSGMVRRLI